MPSWYVKRHEVLHRTKIYSLQAIHTSFPSSHSLWTYTLTGPCTQWYTVVNLKTTASEMMLHLDTLKYERFPIHNNTCILSGTSKMQLIFGDALWNPFYRQTTTSHDVIASHIDNSPDNKTAAYTFLHNIMCARERKTSLTKASLLFYFYWNFSFQLNCTK